MATIRERRTNSGEVRYHAQVRLKGHEPQTASFTRKTDARKWAESTEAAIREGRHFPNSEAKRHSVSEAIDRYLREVMPRKKPSTQHPQTLLLEWWRQQIGDHTLADVKPPLIIEKRNYLLSTKGGHGKTRSNASANRYTAVLSHVFSIAILEWEWTETNPFRKVMKLEEPPGRVRFLTQKERDDLLEACKASEEPLLYPVVVVALSTGMRKGEILGLRWGIVDFERHLITLLDTKNKDVRSVPLVGLAHSEMDRLAKVRRLDTDLCFPGKKLPSGEVLLVNIRAPWEAARKESGLQNFRFHDLRHSCASYLAMNGATDREIQEILGHRSTVMTRRYSHLSQNHTRGVLERMNEGIFGPASAGAKGGA